MNQWNLAPFGNIKNVSLCGPIICLCVILGVVLRCEHTLRFIYFFFKYFLCPLRKYFPLAFGQFNSWSVVLSDLPAVMVACRRCETRS